MANPAVTYRIAAVDDTQGAIASALAGFRRLEGAIQGVRSQFGLIGGALGAGVFLGFVNQGIQAADRLDELAQKTSLSVETLDSLSQVARISGQDLDGVASVAGRFARSIGEASAGNKELLAALRDVGITADDLRSKSFDELFVTFGRAIAEAGNQQTAFAVAAKLAGRNVQELLPFFNDLSREGLAAARITTEQAAAAAEYNDNLGRLRREVDAVAIAMGNNLVPRLNDVAEAMRRAREEGGGFVQQLIRGTQALITGTDLDKARADFKRLGDDLVRLDRDLERLGSGRGADGEDTPLVKRLKRQREQIVAELNQVNAVLLVEQNTLGNAPRPAPPRTVGSSSLEDPGSSAGGRALDETLRREQRLQQESVRGWVAYADAVFDEAERLDRELANIADDRFRREADERARAERQLVEAIERQIELEREAGLAANGGKAAGNLADEARRASDAARELGLTFQSAFEDAVIAGDSFREVLRGIGQDLIRLSARKLVTEPLVGAVSPFLAGAFSSLKGLIPSFDVGTPYVPRDMLAMVHEGERIVPAGANRAGSGAVTVNQALTINVGGGAGAQDPSALAATLGPAIRAATRDALVSEMRPGGLLAGA